MTAMSDGSSSAQQAPERVLRGGPVPVYDALDRLDLLEKNLGRQIEAIRASDTKITFLVPTLTGMLGFLAANVTRAAPGSPIVAYTLLSAAPLVLAYAFLALTVIPRMTSDSRSHLFFGDISRQSPEAYREAMRSLTRAAYIDELAGQCHATAMIARTKYRHVRNAYLAFFVALPFWATAIYLVNRAS
jgi:Family of unknown function (DUF5706)